MAQRRMIALSVVSTDRFTALSLTAQALYFQLVLRADDDGFVSNPKSIQRMIGASDADSIQLKAAGLMIDFPSGVQVVTDWRTMNRISPAKYQPTTHRSELGMLYLTTAERYTTDPGQGVVRAIEVAGDAERYKGSKATLEKAIGEAYKAEIEAKDDSTDAGMCPNKSFEGSGQCPEKVQPSIVQYSITENDVFRDSPKTDVCITDPDTGEIIDPVSVESEGSTGLTEDDLARITAAWNDLCGVCPDVFKKRARAPKMGTQIVASIEAFVYDMDLDGVTDLCDFMLYIPKTYYPGCVRDKGIPARRFEWLFDRDYRQAQENMVSLYKRYKDEAAKAAEAAAQEAAAREAEQRRMYGGGQQQTTRPMIDRPARTQQPAQGKRSIRDLL